MSSHGSVPNPEKALSITRRRLIVLGGTFVLSGCSPHASGPDEAPPGGRSSMTAVDAGPVRNYMAKGTYGRFRQSHGFFIVREGAILFAQSAVCTHRDCLVSPAENGFKCRCHGSTFTLNGHVTSGPARRDLPRFQVGCGANSHVIVYPARRVTPAQFNSPGAYLQLPF